MISNLIASDKGRLYVIGDIHGRSDLLDNIADQISRDLAANPASDCLIVTIGDYIDRGPDSRGVLDRLADNPFPTDFVALKGNHEALFEMFLDDPAVAAHWRRLGGLETLHSYGVPVPNVAASAHDLLAITIGYRLNIAAPAAALSRRPGVGSVGRSILSGDRRRR